jgi:hypothetical protein
MFASTFLLLQLAGDRYSDNTATVTNTRQVLSIEEKVKLIREIENRKKNPDVCREFDFVNFTVADPRGRAV